MNSISIVTTCYNQAHMFGTFLESIRQQTRRPLELIVVDDGSTVGDIEQTVAGWPDLGVRVIKQPNRGVSAARNTGLAQVRGDWVLFVDGDDWLMPRGLEHLGSLADSRSDADLAFGRSQRVSFETGESLGESKFVSEDFYEHMLLSCFPQHPAQVLIRKGALSAGGFNRAAQPCEDFELYLRLLSRHQAVATDALVSCYGIHQLNLSNDPFKMLRSVLTVYELHKPIIGSDPILRDCFSRGRASQRNLYLGRCLKEMGTWLRGRSRWRPNPGDLQLVARHTAPAVAGAILRRLFRSTAQFR